MTTSPTASSSATPREPSASFNRAAERILRATSDGAVGRRLADVLPLVDDQGRDWWACNDPFAGLGTRTRQPERRLLLPDGRALLVTASFVRAPDHALERFLVVLRDDRARERTERSRAISSRRWRTSCARR